MGHLQRQRVALNRSSRVLDSGRAESARSPHRAEGIATSVKARQSSGMSGRSRVAAGR